MLRRRFDVQLQKNPWQIQATLVSENSIIKTHVRGFFDTDLHEVSWHFEVVRPSGF